MAVAGDSADRRASREATDWLIALREDPDDAALRARFEAWIAADPAHEAAWEETHHLDGLIGQAQPALLQRQSQVVDLAAHRVRRRPRQLALVGALSMVAACLILVFAPGVLLQLQASHTTATAEIRSLRLEDGSTVQLGPASAIDVAFEAGVRRVHLLKGEAFFQVVPDASRPFVVQSGEVRTTVVGTAFDVRWSAGNTEVAVRSGIVRVAFEAATPPIFEELVAGDTLRVGPAGQVKRGHSAPDEVAAWLSGQIVARDRSVADIVEELRRYHRGAVVIADDGLARERVTGVYNLSDPSAALRAVASAHAATVRQMTPWLVVLSR
jgi:transmembrane sensor